MDKIIDQPPALALNTVFWRLAVAVGWIDDGDGEAEVDVDELLDYVITKLENEREAWQK